MRRPSAQELEPTQFRVVTTISRRLGEAGFPSWIVGGAARDLARGVCPKDVDMVTSATPAEVETGVCQIIEETVSSVTGVEKVTSTSTEGVGAV